VQKIKSGFSGGEKAWKKKKRFLRRRKGDSNENGHFSGRETGPKEKNGFSPPEKRRKKIKRGFLCRRKGEKENNRVFSGGEKAGKKIALSPPAAKEVFDCMFLFALYIIYINYVTNVGIFF
jgi:hypothetical protein